MKKSTGVIRQIDELGRFVLPIEIRRSLGINLKDSIEIFTEGDRIILQKHEVTCLFCGSAEDVLTYEKKCICRRCLDALRAL